MNSVPDFGVANDFKYYYFIFNFSLGALDPSHSGFVGQTSVVVGTLGTNQPLMLEPRDEYNNLCTYTPEADHKDNYMVTLVEVRMI